MDNPTDVQPPVERRKLQEATLQAIRIQVEANKAKIEKLANHAEQMQPIADAAKDIAVIARYTGKIFKFIFWIGAFAASLLGISKAWDHFKGGA